jgi:hypothetical protein
MATAHKVPKMSAAGNIQACFIVPLARLLWMGFMWFSKKACSWFAG